MIVALSIFLLNYWIRFLLKSNIINNISFEDIIFLNLLYKFFLNYLVII